MTQLTDLASRESILRRDYLVDSLRLPSGGTKSAFRLPSVGPKLGSVVGLAAHLSVHFGPGITVHEEWGVHMSSAAQLRPFRAEPPARGLAAHWRRNNFASRLFHLAATGRYPKKASEGDPVPFLAAPWPGVVARGRGAAARADAWWVPIAPGLTPHGLRHTYRTLMEELGTPKKLMDAQMGHEDGSIGARYAHVTALMVGRLTADLTEAWQAALDARLAMSPGSPVAVLDCLLTTRREGAE